jgi:hypothetical protein
MFARLLFIFVSGCSFSLAQAQVSPDRFSAVQLRETANAGVYLLSFIVVDPTSRKELARPSLTVSASSPAKFEVTDPLTGNTFVANIAMRSNRQVVDCSVEIRNGTTIVRREIFEIGLAKDS